MILSPGRRSVHKHRLLERPRCASRRRGEGAYYCYYYISSTITIIIIIVISSSSSSSSTTTTTTITIPSWIVAEVKLLANPSVRSTQALYYVVCTSVL